MPMQKLIHISNKAYVFMNSAGRDGHWPCCAVYSEGISGSRKEPKEGVES